jgi:hypothetical protein
MVSKPRVARGASYPGLWFVPILNPERVASSDYQRLM